MRLRTVKYVLILSVSFMGGVGVLAQGADTAKRAVSDTSLPSNIPRPVYGPNDTIIVPAKIYDGELLPANNIQYDYVRAPMTAASRRRL
jgi:hypothetical protein